MLCRLVPSLLLSWLCALVVVAPGAAVAAPTDRPMSTDALERGDPVALDVYIELLDEVARKGEVPLIVRLQSGFSPEAGLDLAGAAQQRQGIQARQAGLLAELSGRRVENVKRFETVPFVAMTVDSDGLADILASPHVAGVQLDVPVRLNLHDSVPLIGADNLASEGFDGAGVTVAILDTGVNSAHQFLDGGKVVSEACYSTTNAGDNATSACPGGVQQSTAPGSGAPCDTFYDAGCDHGTHVAGIAAGKNGTGASGGTLQGVAPGANIIAMQVFSLFDDFVFCGSLRCIASYSSDQLMALERVYALRNTYDIAAVNMSLGGGQHASTCDGDSRKAIIDQLRAAGIATVISSGNEFWDGFTGAPGCISSAITVGSTTKLDGISSFSNHATWVDVMAPGSSIQSAVLSGYGTKSGTSMAAPTVTGCWALLKQRSPASSVTAIESALEASGLSVMRAGITKPRINCDAVFPATSTYYVEPGGSCGGESGCYTNLQSAIDAASAWDTIRVAMASYPTQTTINRSDLMPIRVEGGWNTSFSARASKALTIGDGYGADVTISSGHVRIGASAVDESCSDSIQNQDETDVDCGGSVCAGCGIGQSCSIPSDCASGNCMGGTCAGVGSVRNEVRLLNLLNCAAQPFTLQMQDTGSGQTWQSFTSIVSPYQDFNNTTIGPLSFDFGACGPGSTAAPFPLIADTRYRIDVGFDGVGVTVTYVNEGVVTRTGPSSAVSAFVEKIPAPEGLMAAPPER